MLMQVADLYGTGVLSEMKPWVPAVEIQTRIAKYAPPGRVAGIRQSRILADDDNNGRREFILDFLGGEFSGSD